MATDRVRRVQELRRSNAAVPRPGRRPAGPDPSEWDDEAGAAFAADVRALSCPEGPHTGSGDVCPTCGRPTRFPELREVLAATIARQRAGR
jgi:hypothetical protein